MPPLIELADVCFRYDQGEFALGVDAMTFKATEHWAVVGPSGSGKTTLLSLIAGILTPQTGVIRFEGQRLDQLSNAQRRRLRILQMGLIFQEFELIEYLSILDNIVLPYRLNTELRLTPAVRRRAVDLAEHLQIADKLRRYPTQLSQGERQRVAICRGLITEPRLVLADEPTGNLDPTNKLRVLDLMLQVVRERRSTLIAVTHDHTLLDRFDHTLDFATLLTSSA